jgi:hypothetical protein
MKKENETNAIDAAIKIIQKYYGIDLTNAEKSYPDEENNRSKDIDCIIKGKSKRYAIEHSIIEHYEGQIEYIYHSYEIIEKINKRIAKYIPQDRFFTVLVEPKLIISKKKSVLRDLSNYSEKELLQLMGEMEIDRSINLIYKNEEIVVLCESMEGIDNGRVYRAPTSPKRNLGEMIEYRAKRLFDLKIWKLIPYKLRGFKTVLVIEDISGMHMMGIDKKYVGIIHRIISLLFIDMILILKSNNNEMIVGGIWKCGFRWNDNVPMNRRFVIDRI